MPNKTPVFFAALVLLVLSGCAFTTDRVDLQHTPQLTFSRVQGADNVTVNVIVTDLRQDKNKVSNKKNGFGMETAAITAARDVPVIIREAIEKELQQRGFRIGSDAQVHISADLTRFYNDFRTGVFSGDAAATLSMLVTVNSKEGKRLYLRQIDTEGIESGIQLMTGANAALALNKALKNGMDTLFSDNKFLSALLATDK